MRVRRVRAPRARDALCIQSWGVVSACLLLVAEQRRGDIPSFENHRSCGMLVRSWRRAGRGLRTAGVGGAALLVLAALLARMPVRWHASLSLPAASPARAAHVLAEFSLRHAGTWELEDESGNYTSWRYSVRYACGARCEGRARVEAHDVWGEGGAAHGHAAAARRVHVHDERCERVPLLGWPRFCEETETDSWVFPLEGEGARVEESAVAWCGLWRALGSEGGMCGGEMRAAGARRAERLRSAGGAH